MLRLGRLAGRLVEPGNERQHLLLWLIQVEPERSLRRTLEDRDRSQQRMYLLAEAEVASNAVVAAIVLAGIIGPAVRDFIRLLDSSTNTARLR
jgi:hypothetical protein